jgi:hypothetical protein
MLPCPVARGSAGGWLRPALEQFNRRACQRATIHRVKPVIAFFRQNPQVFVLLLICLILGLGTFLAVIFGLVAAGNGSTTGEPSGMITSLRAIASVFLI